MSTPILTTKLYPPPPRPNVVPRPRLLARLNAGLREGEGFARKVTLISAPAGFGKTTLVSEWIRDVRLTADEGESGQSKIVNLKFAWLSLDEGDNDPARFLAYLVAALRTVAEDIGEGVLAGLQSPQPPPPEALLSPLLNEIAALSHHFVLVLDDFHVVEAQAIGHALTFLVEHLPPQMHLVIASREDPPLPLPRLRARGRLTEIRANDLRFSAAEAADFLNRAMGLDLREEEIAALDGRTEGWIAGLQLAALALQGLVPQGATAVSTRREIAGFIQSFTGSHHFVLDYLLTEVLHQQPESIQTFLLRTSILDRLCGPLCEAVLGDPAASGQQTLEYLERANLFIVPLDRERRWYRYHRLFAELLRQRLHRHATSTDDRAENSVATYHIRASQWYEANHLELEAFQHAAAANDVARAERLIEGDGIPLHIRGATATVLSWLASLPPTVMNARPSLWVKHASTLLAAGQTTGVAQKLQAAEDALANVAKDEKVEDLIGQIAAARATLALTQYQPETIGVQARRALAHLHPDNLPFRFTAVWTLAFAHHLQGDRAAAAETYRKAITISHASGDVFSTILATNGLGQVQEVENKLYAAAESYRQVLHLFGNYPQPNACEAHLGLARIHYQWNELAAAAQHAQESARLARQYDKAIDRFVLSELFLVRLQLARGDVDGAAARLDEVEEIVQRQNFVQRVPEVAAAQVRVLLYQQKQEAAARLAAAHDLPVSQARVLLARGNAPAALERLQPWRRQVTSRGWEDERLRVLVLEAVLRDAHGEKETAVQLLKEALTRAKPGGFIRLFVDEGLPMAQLLSVAAAREWMPHYTGKLLAAFKAEEPNPPALPTFAQLSQRELEVLQLVAQGLSNREIGERLFLALNTVKTHNRNIFGKLQVQRRTEAVARARELGLL